MKPSEVGAELTVIVPIWNAEETLTRCLSSIEQLSAVGATVILVDNGSDDDSHRIAADWASLHGARLLVEPRNGVSAARNLGLRDVDTKFVTFVDSDDWVSAPELLDLVEALEFTSAEVGRCSMAVVSVADDQVRELDVVGVGPGKAAAGTSLLDPSTGVHGVIYRSALLSEEGIQFPPGQIGEDLAFNYLVTAAAPLLIGRAQVGYYYCVGRSQALTAQSYSMSELAQTLLQVCPTESVDPRVRRVYARLVVRALLGALRRNPRQWGSALEALLRCSRSLPHGRRELAAATAWTAFEYRTHIGPAAMRTVRGDRGYLPTSR